MAAIDQYLQQILEATYGEEVRHSIHDAILQNYNDVTESARLANEAASNANTAAANADTKAALADTAATNADTKAALANTAAQNADTKAGLAETAATNADTKAALANTAAQNADTKAALANTAAQNANTARDAANTAATNANEKATLANTAATNADTKATLADTAATNADTKAGLANEAAERVNEIADAIDAKVSTDTETVTDNPVTVETDSAQVAEKTVIKLEPKQDLHGYDHPWPAGSGKNLFPDTGLFPYSIELESPTYFIEFTTSIAGRKIPEIRLSAGITYTFSIDTQSNVEPFDISVGCGNGNYARDIATSSSNNSGRVSLTFTPTEEQLSIGNIFAFRAPRYSSLKNISATLDKPQLEIGSTVSPFSPYSNICPIEGFDGIEVKRTGKNLLDIQQFASNKTTISGDVVTFVSTGSFQASNFAKIPVEYNKTYYLSFTKLSDRIALELNVIDVNNNLIASLPTVYGNRSIVIDNPAIAYISLALASRGMGAVTIKCEKMQIEIGTTATDYEPYQGETYDISFPTEAGTVYGGTLTIEKDSSGELVVTHGMVDLGDMTWLYDGVFSAMVPGIAKNAYTSTNLICTSYPTKPLPYSQFTYGIRYSGGASSVGVKDSTYSDATTFKAAMSGVQLVYELATPITYTLSAEQVKLLKGINHVSTDGTNLDLTVRKGTFATLDDVADISALFKIIADDYENTNTKLEELFNAIDTYGPQEETASEIAREILKSCAYFKAMADATDNVKEDE